MIRKAIIVLLTLGAVGVAVFMLSDLRSEREGGWLWRSSSFLDIRFVLNHREMVVARDVVLPGQALDPTFATRALRQFSEAREAGEVTPSQGIMEDSFVRVGILGVRWGKGQYADEFGRRIDCHVVIASLWLLLALFIAYPTIAFIRGPLRRWRRRRKGLCLWCGYDLVGNVSGVCPECGTELELR